MFPKQLIEDAILAEETFDLDDLEEFAIQWRKENGYD